MIVIPGIYVDVNGQPLYQPKAANTGSLVSIQITYPNTIFEIENYYQFRLIGTFTDGSTADLTAAASWRTSDSTLATIQTGLLYIIQSGTISIIAQLGNLQSNVVITVSSIGFYVGTYTIQPSDGTDFYIPITTQIDNLYAVKIMQIAGTNMVTTELPYSDRTTSHFHVITSGTLNSGDVLQYVIFPSNSTDGMIVRRTISQPTDGTDFTVTISAQATDTYGVTAQLVQGNSMVTFELPDESPSDRTTTSFRCITSGTLSTGDIIEFIIVNP